MTHEEEEHVKTLLGLLSWQDQVMFAAACAERALTTVHATNERLWSAVRVARLVSMAEAAWEEAARWETTARAAAGAAWAAAGAARAAAAAARAATAARGESWAARAAESAAWAAAWAALAAEAARATTEEIKYQIDDLHRLISGEYADVPADQLAVDLDVALERGLDHVVATFPRWAKIAVVYNDVKFTNIACVIDIN